MPAGGEKCDQDDGEKDTVHNISTGAGMPIQKGAKSAFDSCSDPIRVESRLELLYRILRNAHDGN